MFADDSYLSLSHSSPVILENAVNTELRKIKSWLEENKLSLNVQKTSYMIFNGRKAKYDYEIMFGSSQLTQVTEIKYLGVTLDDKMSWNSHIKRLNKRLSSSVWALSRLKNIVPERSLMTIYYGLIHSSLIYCISCWGGTSSNKLRKTQKLQERALNIIIDQSTDKTTDIYKQLNILTVSDQYRFQIAIIMHKTKRNVWAGNFNLTSMKSIHNHFTRFSSHDTYQVLPAKNEIFKRCLKFVGPSIWNSIPEDIKSDSIFTFKNKLKQHFLNR